jgi:hypothetical protein
MEVQLNRLPRQIQTKKEIQTEKELPSQISVTRITRSGLSSSNNY